MKAIKKIKLLLIMACISFFNFGITQAQQIAVNKISNVIHAFAEAMDSNDVSSLEKHLSSNYRIVMNQFHDSKDFVSISRLNFLDKIIAHEFGVDHRDVLIENITLNGPTASAKVIFYGMKSRSSSLFLLVQVENGQWKIIEELRVQSFQ